MSGIDPVGQRPQDPQPSRVPTGAGSSAAARAGRLSPGNMARSLLPLVLICLAVVGWFSWQQNGVDPVRTVETGKSVELAASRASYPLLVPTGLPAGYRPTSVRTDAADAQHGDPVTLQIGYVTPSEAFTGFAESDDPHADALTSVLKDAQRRGTVDLGGHVWTRWTTTTRGETALSRQVGAVTVVVNGSASEQELEAVAGAVQTYSG